MQQQRESVCFTNRYCPCIVHTTYIFFIVNMYYDLQSFRYMRYIYEYILAETAEKIAVRTDREITLR